MCSTDESINCDDYVDSIISTMKKLPLNLSRNRRYQQDTSRVWNSISKGGMCTLGKESAGILGFVDASEMPDTYGAAFTEFRGSAQAAGLEPVLEGDISDRGFLYRISIQQFVDDIFPTLTENDSVLALHASATSKGDKDAKLIDQLTMREKRKCLCLSSSVRRGEYH